MGFVGRVLGMALALYVVFTLGREVSDYSDKRSVQIMPTVYVTSRPYLSPTIKPTDDPNPIVDCAISKECGGGTQKMKLNRCNISTCCLVDSRCGGPRLMTVSECKTKSCCFLRDGTAKLLASKSACDNYYSQGSGSSNTTQLNVTGAPRLEIVNSASNSLYSCTLRYPASGTIVTYNYSYKNKTECDTAQAKLNSEFPSGTPSTKVTTIDSTACNAQYNSDVQRANMYGGTVGTAMIDLAKKNLTNCLSSGQITEVGTIQTDSRPRDRDGRLCSEYPDWQLSLSQSLGCP